jgi:hypothetical protein
MSYKRGVRDAMQVIRDKHLGSMEHHRMLLDALDNLIK